MKNKLFRQSIATLISITGLISCSLTGLAESGSPSGMDVPISANLDSSYTVSVPSTIMLTSEYNNLLKTDGDTNSTYYGLCDINIKGSVHRPVKATVTCDDMTGSAGSVSVGLNIAGEDKVDLENILTGNTYNGEAKEFSSWTSGTEGVSLDYTITEVNTSEGTTKDVLLHTTFTKDGTYSSNLKLDFGLGEFDYTGMTFNMGSYKWLVVKNIEDSKYAMQVCGVSDNVEGGKIMSYGFWPSYKAKGDFSGTDYTYQNIASTTYVDPTKASDLLSTYEAVKSAEAEGGFNDSTGIWESDGAKDGFYLMPYDKINPVVSGNYSYAGPNAEDTYYLYWKGLKDVADANRTSSAFGASDYGSWLGTRVSVSSAYNVLDGGNVGNGFQNYDRVLAPAFNIDATKINIDPATNTITPK